MGLIKRKKCKHCSKLFIPDYRNRDRQNYCDNRQCRKTGKKASQEKWLNKPENKNYFKSAIHVNRVRQWRKQNPGYWKKKTHALQETLNVQLIENKEDNSKFAQSALQDLLIKQPPVIIGLISNFIGSTLQDDIAQSLLCMQQSGQDILYYNSNKGGHYDCKNPDYARKDA